MSSRIKARIVKTKDEGSCNHCVTRSTKDVLLIELRSMNIRLCRACVAQLLLVTGRRIAHMKEGAAQ